MRLVQDTIFCEILEFEVEGLAFRHCAIAVSQEEVLRKLMATVGIELIDYGSWFATPWKYRQLPDAVPAMRVLAYSKAYRERAERATALR
jgi:hypothetical protein